jgi:hypothetical protein
MAMFMSQLANTMGRTQKLCCVILVVAALGLIGGPVEAKPLKRTARQANEFGSMFDEPSTKSAHSIKDVICEHIEGCISTCDIEGGKISDVNLCVTVLSSLTPQSDAGGMITGDADGHVPSRSTGRHSSRDSMSYWYMCRCQITDWLSELTNPHPHTEQPENDEDSNEMFPMFDSVN